MTVAYAPATYSKRYLEKKMRITLLVSLLILTGCAKPADQTIAPETVEASARPYTGFKQDLACLRDTYLLEKQNIRASSAKALTAANRVFTRTTFKGMTKDAVLRLLGDPETISDYGEKKGQGIDDPLVYRFDNGMDGDQWTIMFQNGVVTKVEHAGIE